MSFNDVVGTQEQGRSHFQAEHSGGLEIDGQFEFGRLLDRKIAGLCALENPIHVRRGIAMDFGGVGLAAKSPAASGG